MTKEQKLSKKTCAHERILHGFTETTYTYYLHTWTHVLWNCLKNMKICETAGDICLHCLEPWSAWCQQQLDNIGDCQASGPRQVDPDHKSLRCPDFHSYQLPMHKSIHPPLMPKCSLSHSWLQLSLYFRTLLSQVCANSISCSHQWETEHMLCCSSSSPQHQLNCANSPGFPGPLTPF